MNNEERKERRRRAVARSKFVLPSIITLLSMLFSFSSVVMSINAAGNNPSYYLNWAAKFLIFSGICDGLDGRIARATNTTSEFGVQLDSLADVISFGMAPAVLAYQYGFCQIVATANPQIRAASWAASFFFVACSALRLARFNVQVSFVDNRFFVGMPTPVGAACVASIILYSPNPLTTSLQVYLFAIELFLVGLLMVSNVRFPSFKKRFKSKDSTGLTTTGTALLILIMILWNNQLLVVLCATYLLSAIAINAGWRIGWHGIEPPIS
jgi:CDP-diacylglycerol--serine O-phosphatidyltransferase